MSAQKKQNGGKRTGAGRPRKTGPSKRDGLVLVTAYVTPQTVKMMEEFQASHSLDSRGEALTLAFGLLKHSEHECLVCDGTRIVLDEETREPEPCMHCSRLNAAEQRARHRMTKVVGAERAESGDYGAADILKSWSKL